MSADQSHHLSAERLLLLVDGELQPRETATATAHLRHCASCRERHEQFEASSERFAKAYRRERAASTAPSRDALKAQLAEVNSSAGRPGPSWLAACALLTAGLIALQFLSDRSGPSAMREVARHDDVRPLAYLTPGATRPIAVADLCTRRVAAPQEIPSHVRLAVVRDYRMESLPDRDYELDYLITPELGGSGDRRNLWPERYTSALWNARVKDELEQLLPTLVCAGTLPLAVAQRDMASDWIAAYKKYFRTDRPLHQYPGSEALDIADDRAPSTPDFGSSRMPTLRYEPDSR
jgi:hypothetical protein